MSSCILSSGDLSRGAHGLGLGCVISKMPAALGWGPGREGGIGWASCHTLWLSSPAEAVRKPGLTEKVWAVECGEARSQGH